MLAKHQIDPCIQWSTEQEQQEGPLWISYSSFGASALAVLQNRCKNRRRSHKTLTICERCQDNLQWQFRWACHLNINNQPRSKFHVGVDWSGVRYLLLANDNPNIIVFEYRVSMLEYRISASKRNLDWFVFKVSKPINCECGCRFN